MASGIVVQKYGGSSVADADRIRNVARRVAARRKTHENIVVVVSAMGKTTDGLIALANQLSNDPPMRELDLLLSTGEMQTTALLAIALQSEGLDAVSLTGFQAGIRTESHFGRARILSVDPDRITRELQAGRVVIVAGFQGFTGDMDITTIGRGGSDTTAVALAASLEADVCEIYTDVEGVYTADPRMEPKARKLAEISYEEMLELASHGAKVMASRAVELGWMYKMPILVASSMVDAPGTLIHMGASMEQGNKVAGIAHDLNVGKVTLIQVPDRPGIAAHLFGPLAEAGISVDTIVQNTGHAGATDMSFTVSKGDLPKARTYCEKIAAEIGAERIETNDAMGNVSIVGSGMQSAPGYAARMFRALYDAGINIEMITTSEIRITCIIASTQVPDAVRALHTAFDLETPEA